MSEYADPVRFELHGSSWLDPPVDLEAAAAAGVALAAQAAVLIIPITQQAVRAVYVSLPRRWAV